MADERSNLKNQQTVGRDGALLGAHPPVQGVTRPPVRAAQSQLALGVIDVSPSMYGPKLDEANAAMETLWNELIDPKNRDAFWIGEVIYASRAAEHLSPKRATAVRREELVAQPNAVGDGTNITAGLAKALEVLERTAKERTDWTRPVAVLLTDGKHLEGPPPDGVAGAVKAVADLVCIGFGRDAELALLRRLSSNPQLTFTCPTGAELRRVFQQVGASMSKSRATGQGVASILGAPTGGVVRG